MAKRNKSINPVSLITVSEPSSTVAEQYRTIRSNIQFSSVDKDMKTLVVTSSGPGEGKSTTAANLAIIFANAGKKVIIVDADLRKPSVAMSFKLANANGLSNVLGDREANLEDYIKRSGVDNLYVLTSGPKPPNPSEMLDSERMKEIIEILDYNFDLVIFDMPPVVNVTDAQILAAKVDGTILVVREHKTNKQALIKAKELLELSNANILGVVYNAAKLDHESEYYYYS